MTSDMLHISHTFNASPEVVWSAWTDPVELARWWWPEHFRTSCHIDLREGGAYRFQTAEFEDGGSLSIAGRILTVRPPELLVYTWIWGDEEQETAVRVEFVPQGTQTEACLTLGPFAEGEERDNQVLGWNHCLDRLDTVFAARAHPLD